MQVKFRREQRVPKVLAADRLKPVLWALAGLQGQYGNVSGPHVAVKRVQTLVRHWL